MSKSCAMQCPSLIRWVRSCYYRVDVRTHLRLFMGPRTRTTCAEGYMEARSQPVQRTTKRCPSRRPTWLLRTLTLGRRRSLGTQITASCKTAYMNIQMTAGSGTWQHAKQFSEMLKGCALCQGSQGLVLGGAEQGWGRGMGCHSWRLS